MMKVKMVKFLVLIGLSAVSVNGLSDAKSIIVQSTTSTANSGLYDFLLPEFTKKYGIKVHVVAVGTGQAIKNARNCDGDVLLVHAKSSEEQFVAEGYADQRFDLMYNDFVFVGPEKDVAEIAKAGPVTQVLNVIAERESIFLSRGDNSGTHKKELSLWRETGVDLSAVSGSWYRETGSGMGATLNIAVGMGGYTMTDRATWLSFNNKSDFTILAQGDQSLFNQYGVMVVNSTKCPETNSDSANVFVDWLLSTEGQKAIADYQLNGQQLFFPNAGR